MNAGATADRVYEALKQQLLSGSFRPGERLEPSIFAETLLASVTPVRDALNRLTGEGLVETRASEGFHVPPIFEPMLRDLYRWNAQVLGLAVRDSNRRATGPAPRGRPQTNAPDEDSAALFAAVAARSRNIEHCRAIARNNDRLQGVRRAEVAALDGIDAELDALWKASGSDNAGALMRLVNGYHRRRIASVETIISLLYKG